MYFCWPAQLFACLEKKHKSEAGNCNLEPEAHSIIVQDCWRHLHLEHQILSLKSYSQYHKIMCQVYQREELFKSQNISELLTSYMFCNDKATVVMSGIWDKDVLLPVPLTPYALLCLFSHFGNLFSSAIFKHYRLVISCSGSTERRQKGFYQRKWLWEGGRGAQVPIAN